MHIGHRVRDRRSELGVNQIELANYLGMDQAQLSRLESQADWGNVTVRTTIKIAAALKVTVPWILGMDAERERDL